MKRLKQPSSAVDRERIITYAAILTFCSLFWGALAWLASRAL